MVVRINVGQRCNADCPYCLNAAARGDPSVDMSADVAEVVFAVIARLPERVSSLTIVGGEPTCMPWLPTRLAGLTNVDMVELITNGVDRAMLRRCVAAVPDDVEQLVIVSCHDGIYNHHRDQLAKLVRCMNELKAMYANLTVHYKLLFDGHRVMDYASMIDWIIDNVEDQLEFSSIRADADVRLPLRTLSAVRSWPSPHGGIIRAALRRALSYRAQPHPFCGQRCPHQTKVLNFSAGKVYAHECADLAEQLVIPITTVDEVLAGVKRIGAEEHVCTQRRVYYACDLLLATETDEVINHHVADVADGADYE